VSAAHDYSDLHELIDRLEPEQAEELREHALRLVKPVRGRFKVLRAISGPGTDLGARAREVIRAELGKAMLIAGTGPLVAYLNRNDPDQFRCAALLESRTISS
jgi:hypothetical protein